MKERKGVTFFLSLSIALLHFSTLHAQDSSFILETESLALYTPTYLANGYFSMVTSQLGTKPTESYMARVYDHGGGDVPRVAVLPAWNEVDFFNGKSWLNNAALDKNTLRSYRQSLDMYNGSIETIYDWADGEKNTSIQVHTFVSRSNVNLAATELEITPHYSGRVKVSFPLRAWDAPHRMPLSKLENIVPDPAGTWPSVWYPGHMSVKDRHAEANLQGGWLWMNSQAEGRPTAVAQAVAVTWPEDLKELATTTSVSEDMVSLEISFEASAERRYAFHKYVSVVASHDTPSPLEKANQTVQVAKTRGYKFIFDDHAEAWHKLWETDILVENDPELQRLIHSMIFYLLCSVREGSEFSIPAMGLSTAGYYGHIFWDADTWMFPVLLVMHPEMAKSMVMFRYRTLEAAKQNARLNGYKGAMYPWEADELGLETTPKFAYQNALYEIHVTGDVALAQWQFYLATGDKQWLAQYGYPVIKETADFWASRVAFNEEQDRYEIRGVVSVDEGLIGINNDAYTNSIAKKNLEIAVTASSVLGTEANLNWEKISAKLYIPYDTHREYHPTYEGAPPATLGSVVPLLSYPLELPMSERAKRNNLEHAIQRIAEKGPGGMMSITFYPIVAAELGDSKLLDELFPKSYRPYLRMPFHVLAETPTSDATNFLTGAGGFLQQVIYGFTGLRLGEGGLVQKFQPLLPSQVKRLTLKNFFHKGRRHDIVVAKNRLRIVERRRHR